MTDVTTTILTKDARLSTVMNKNSLLVDMGRQYLSVVDEIAAYNKDVLAEKDSEWNASKVLAEARKVANPEDANTPADQEMKALIDQYEEQITKTARARKAVLDAQSKKLGITLSATADRNAETEAPMRERRKLAIEIQNQLGMMTKVLQDATLNKTIVTFLEENPLPAIGRDQLRTFGSNETATPKYRVNVVVTNADGQIVSDAAGFTKTAQNLTKYYPRGEGIKANVLREAWEKSGNTQEKTVTNPVEFDDNDMHFVITKKD